MRGIFDQRECPAGIFESPSSLFGADGTRRKTDTRPYSLGSIEFSERFIAQNVRILLTLGEIDVTRRNCYDTVAVAIESLLLLLLLLLWS